MQTQTLMKGLLCDRVVDVSVHVVDLSDALARQIYAEQVGFRHGT
ncbi:MAG: hypothetical protein OSA42_03375 [Porticoccaceae bacterium]|nr:hypothetical protein [Porticoccaceae bacterium]